MWRPKTLTPLSWNAKVSKSRYKQCEVTPHLSTCKINWKILKKENIPSHVKFNPITPGGLPAIQNLRNMVRWPFASWVTI